MSDKKIEVNVDVQKRIAWICKRTELTEIQKSYVLAMMKDCVIDALEQANDILETKEAALSQRVNDSSFGELVIVQNVKNPCKLCKYNGKTSDKSPCSWCSDYIGRNGYYR